MAKFVEGKKYTLFIRGEQGMLVPVGAKCTSVSDRKVTFVLDYDVEQGKEKKVIAKKGTTLSGQIIMGSRNEQALVKDSRGSVIAKAEANIW